MLHGKLSLELQQLLLSCPPEGIELQKLLENLSLRGQALTISLLALPFLLPIPMPGLSIIFGGVLLFLGIGVASGLPPWVPKAWRRTRIRRDLLEKVINFVFPWVKRLEKIVRPRGRFLTEYPGLIRLNGAMIAICGLLLSLPLPPGTNFPPALAIQSLAVGMAEEDGLFVAIGYVFFLLNLLFFIAFFAFGVDFIRQWL